jgi:plasmid stabilization system protein ParE
MISVVFDPDARAEFLEAVQYYEDSQGGLGRRFRVAVESAVKSIVENPFRYRVLHPPFRRYLLPNFPYAIIYCIEPENILIIAVAHTKRKPGYWIKRG